MADSHDMPTSTRLRAAAGFLLLGFVAVVGFSFAGRTDPVTSTLDARTLNGLPRPSAESVVDGTWMKRVESWMDDRILGREQWLSLHAKIAQRVLRMREINRIAIDSSTGLLLEEPPALKPNPSLGVYAATLAADIRAAGAVPLFVYVPRKEEVFADLLPPTWPNHYLEMKPQVLDQLAQGGPVLDLTDTVAAQPGRDSNYFLTDHHWSPQGARLGLDAITARLSAMGVSLGTDSQHYTDVPYPEFFGSLARRITAAGAPKGDPFAIPTPDHWSGQLCRKLCTGPIDLKKATSKDLYANRYAAFLGGDAAFQTLINTSPAAKGTILILKDSYGLPLVTYLAQRAKKVVAIDERHYTGVQLTTLMSQLKPDAVLVVHNIRTLLGDVTFDPKLWVDARAVERARKG